jgi:hypothetical protein
MRTDLAFPLAGDQLAYVLSFCTAYQLLLVLPRVNRAFRCTASSPHAWPPALDLAFLPRCLRADVLSAPMRHSVPESLAQAWSRVRSVRFRPNDASLDDALVVSSLRDERLLAAVAGICPRLEIIDGWYVREHAIPIVAAKCPALRQLQLQLPCNAPLEEQARLLGVLLKGCPGLRDLKLDWAGMHDSLVSAVVTALPDLECLNINRPNAVKRAIRGARLRSLWVHTVEDEDLRAIASGCPQLQELTIFAPRVSDTGLVALAQGCTGLRALTLPFDSNEPESAITDAGLSALARGCPLLERLSLFYRLRHVTGAALLVVAEACPRLHTLEIAGWATDAGVAAVAASCPWLRSVQLQQCGYVTDASMYALSNCRQLSSLDVCFCYAITDAGASAVAHGCGPVLRRIAFENTQVSDVGVQAIAAHCRGLLSVELGEAVSDAGLEALQRGCPRLRKVNVDATGHISKEGLIQLLRTCKRLCALRVFVADGCERSFRRALSALAESREVKLDIAS